MSELKAINAHGVRKDDGAYYDRKQADEYIAELDERHTTEITALEVSYRLQLDGLRYDKDAEIRRLKRALWLARANRALEKIAWFKLWNASISTMNPEDGARQEYDKWKKNLGKFLKKVEEYK